MTMRRLIALALPCTGCSSPGVRLRLIVLPSPGARAILFCDNWRPDYAAAQAEAAEGQIDITVGERVEAKYRLSMKGAKFRRDGSSAPFTAVADGRFSASK